MPAYPAGPPFLPRNGEKEGPGGLCRVGRWSPPESPQVSPCEVGPGAPEPPVGRTLRVSRGSYEASGRSAPLPAYPAGPPFLPRNGEKEGRGQAPWTPFFYAHSLPLVPPFALGGAAGTIYRLLRCPFLAPDLGTFFFGEIFLEQIFLRENPTPNFYTRKRKNPDQGTTKGTEIVPQSWQCGTEPKAERAGASGLKKGGAGDLPRDSLRPGFLLEKAWIPARDRAGRTTLQVLTCEGPRRTHLPTANPARWEGNLAMFRRGRLTALSAGGGCPLPGTLGRGTPPGAGRPPGPSTAGGCPRGLSWRRSPCASRR